MSNKKEPLWVREDVLLAMRKRFIAEYGGSEGIRDQGLLQSALNKPQNLFLYEDPLPTIATLAASYAFGISKNHPFVDDNKRVAFGVSQLFLRLNSMKLIETSIEKYRVFMALAKGELPESELANWILESSIKINV